ncbi:MAG: ferritin family protein [Candidatus Syntrophosphaera sp.]|nr:ferritin family protein [Candidatus Syntrophosphaera sp.]
MTQKQELLASIKKAMQGEKDSVTLYENAAAHATDAEVKDFFTSRREEERLHYNYLLNYYQQISGDLQPADFAPSADAGSHPIFSASFIKRIGEDQYLFSAISTALLLEKDAFEHYRKCAGQTDDTNLTHFFQTLEKWEMRHYDELLRIQKEAEQFYWEANRFEPF